MALVSGRSTLNPNAPLFIPAALRQVEDFSPEWWELVNTSTWFREYWLSEHDDEDIFGYGEVDLDRNEVGFLPETFDLSAADDFSGLEGSFEEFIGFSESGEGNGSTFSTVKRMSGNGMDGGAMMRDLSVLISSKERGAKASFELSKCKEKPPQYVSPKCSPRRIQQPR